VFFSKRFWKALFFCFSLFVFPEYCIHCFYRLYLSERIFCRFCKSEIHICLQPPKKKKKNYTAEVFEYGGPLLALIAGIQNKPFSQEEILPYYLVRLHTLKWKRPDYILYDPRLFFLAKLISLHLKRPAFPIPKSHLVRSLTASKKVLSLLLVNQRDKEESSKTSFKVNYLLYTISL